jgi:hypothetical protein
MAAKWSHILSGTGPVNLFRPNSNSPTKMNAIYRKKDVDLR